MTTPNPDLITKTAHALQEAAVDCDQQHRCDTIEGHILYTQAAYIDGKWSDDIDRIEGSTLDIARIALTQAGYGTDHCIRCGLPQARTDDTCPPCDIATAYDVIRDLKERLTGQEQRAERAEATLNQLTTYATNLTEIAPYKTDVGGIGRELLDIIRKGQQP